MRYTGWLLGGSWLASFVADLGGGIFDGADLVQNFENLNPANTLWKKQYNLYSKIDTEEQRFLDFEKWWGGLFLMNAEGLSVQRLTRFNDVHSPNFAGQAMVIPTGWHRDGDKLLALVRTVGSNEPGDLYLIQFNEPIGR